MTYKELVSPALTRFLLKLWNSDESKPHRLGNLFIFIRVAPENKDPIFSTGMGCPGDATRER